MASRILLISANRCTTPDPVFPLGLAHLNAALREAGHQCTWLDTLVSAGRLEEVIRENEPQLVGVSLRNIDDVLIRKQETFFQDLASIAATVRSLAHCPIVVGGSGFSIFPERLLELSAADFGITGEGEAPLLALIAALETGVDYSGIPGLVFRRNGRIQANPAHPGPATGSLRAADRPAGIAAHYLLAAGMLNLQTQRGCSCRCCYCTYPLIEGRQHRRRPAEAVADEFEQLQRLGAKYVFIVDSVFNSSPHHVREICEALVRRGLKLPWGCFLRPQGLTRELMRLMARAGLSHIEFGSDSFCDEVLAAYHKDFTFADILNASELARAEKIDACHFVIAGGPGESRETLERGFANAQRLNQTVIMAVAGMRVYPGTHLFELAVAQGKIHPQVDLWQPVYYFAPGLKAEGVLEQLREFARRSPRWIVGDPDPGYQRLVARLRQRGVAGPLWSYFSLLQQLFPRGLANSPQTGPPASQAGAIF